MSIPLSYETVEVGDLAPDWTVEYLERKDFVRYAGASGDFNPIHYDETFAARVGYPSVFGHGMMIAGFMDAYLTGWVGFNRTRSLKLRFQGQVWPGDSVTVTGTVTRKFEAAGEPRIECRLTAVNQDGAGLLEAVAEVACDAAGAPPA